jgi:6-hydroxynicotinate 3-monooxygenase
VPARAMAGRVPGPVVSKFDPLRLCKATRVERVGQVQRLSIEYSWMRGPDTDDWFYLYDAWMAPLAPPR